ncbi:helix-turn-helix transcriptional regulator [Sulfobacillus thermosulfidooxidans]|uniref:helix-turn-helix transcriptional regulator n=1 Tax=Sulfobacillus thermosulfidooxidans TaxID=28034 RepID=UPI00096BA722|nr:helix-turn-helix transcriptional regulator [Sulfobacillus thermosulfidooxidans]OLZ09088.1 hypothetical protein BFX05_02485 [Sulfobacillus thermosulfidooxidans]OLZ15159.1 hypothetical protein BFX06_04265 [Sulfobacillus thermosulfidooxidans]OLZ22148.1 hypothetical protein BFX07_09785 [Sulfobacillus thermosulfidooxidans]
MFKTFMVSSQMTQSVMRLAVFIWSIAVMGIFVLDRNSQGSWISGVIFIALMGLFLLLRSSTMSSRLKRWHPGTLLLGYLSISVLILYEAPQAVQILWILLSLLPLWHRFAVNSSQHASWSPLMSFSIIIGSLSLTAFLRELASLTLVLMAGTGLAYGLLVLYPTGQGDKEETFQTETSLLTLPHSDRMSPWLMTMALGLFLKEPYIPWVMQAISLPLVIVGILGCPYPPSFLRSPLVSYLAISTLGFMLIWHADIRPWLLLLLLAGTLWAFLMGWEGSESPFLRIPADMNLARGILLGTSYTAAWWINPRILPQVILTLLFMSILPLSWSIARRQEEPVSTLPISPRLEGEERNDEHQHRAEEWLRQCCLTPQEKKITQLLLEGLSNKEITHELYISINTLKTHLRNIYRKTDTANRRELVARYKHGGTNPPTVITS